MHLEHWPPDTYTHRHTGTPSSQGLATAWKIATSEVLYFNTSSCLYLFHSCIPLLCELDLLNKHYSLIHLPSTTDYLVKSPELTLTYNLNYFAS